ncbi:MAG: alpha/beta fold hydrolase [Beijerinckiaceae bacterium]
MSRLPHHGAYFTGADGNRLAATVVGEGARTALLLHGGGQTRHAWDKTAIRLAQHGWTAICADQRGHGDSDWMTSAHYAFTDYARDALCLGEQIAHQHGARPVAIGASMGGLASLLALGQQPDIFSALVLVDITPHMDPTGVDAIQGFMRAKAKDGFASIEEAADAVAAYLPHRPRPKSLEGLKRNLRQSADGRWRWHWDPLFLDGPRPVSHDAENFVRLAEDAARSLRVPTLLVRGQSSELVTDEAAQKFKDLAPHSEFADIAGARHMVAGDRNDAFAEAILRFLNR